MSVLGRNGFLKSALTLSKHTRMFFTNVVFLNRF